MADMFSDVRQLAELRYCLDIYTTGSRPKNGCKIATEKCGVLCFFGIRIVPCA